MGAGMLIGLVLLFAVVVLHHSSLSPTLFMGAGMLIGLVLLFAVVVLLRCRGAQSRAPYVGSDDESTAAAAPSTAAAGLATIVTNIILFVAQFTTEVVGTRR